VAITALARKLICLIHHLLTNQELYQEDNGEMREPDSSGYDGNISSSPEMSLNDKVAAIVDAFYHLKAHKRKGAPRKRSRISHRSGVSSKRQSGGDG
jgi:hypothetical protein